MSLSIRTHYVMLAYYHRWATRRLLTGLKEFDEANFKPLSQPFIATNFAFNKLPSQLGAAPVVNAEPSTTFPPKPIMNEHPYLRDMHLPCHSIHGTLCHLYFAEQLWMLRVTQQSVPSDMAALWDANASDSVWAKRFEVEANIPALPEKSLETATTTVITAEEQMVAQRARNAIGMRLDDQNSDWLEIVKGTAEQDLFAKLEYQETSGLTRNRTKATMFTHVFNHATHHRGQITSAMTQLGLPYPVIDLTAFLPEWEELHSKAFRWA